MVPAPCGPGVHQLVLAGAPSPLPTGGRSAASRASRTPPFSAVPMRPGRMLERELLSFHYRCLSTPVCLLAHRVIGPSENHKSIQLGLAPRGQETLCFSRFLHDRTGSALCWAPSPPALMVTHPELASRLQRHSAQTGFHGAGPALIRKRVIDKSGPSSPWICAQLTSQLSLWQ